MHHIFYMCRSFVSQRPQLWKLYASVTDAKSLQQQESNSPRVIIFPSTVLTVTRTSWPWHSQSHCGWKDDYLPKLKESGWISNQRGDVLGIYQQGKWGWNRTLQERIFVTSRETEEVFDYCRERTHPDNIISRLPYCALHERNWCSPPPQSSFLCSSCSPLRSLPLHHQRRKNYYQSGTRGQRCL